MEGFSMNAQRLPFDRRHLWSIWRGAWAISVVASVAGCGRSEPGSSASTLRKDADAEAKSQAAQLDPAHPVVQLDTSEGLITVRLDAVRAPGTVRSFLDYASSGFYDNTIIHYVDPGRTIAAGGYTSDRTAKPPRSPIRNEAHNGLKNVRGTIAMARDAALIDSATSQFYVNLAEAPQRDYRGDSADQYGYCVFGEVTAGLDVAERISKSPTADLGGDLAQTPDPPVVVKSIRVVR
jgi:cyclophilin family peptidyl-prolyl cis-trans isomerase